ncbi:DUF3750 domain-containing protein [Geopsychrobacter electrodiphilus]|uniref:DUF3750 domain-containing protein n=1 Tax=Geopsychrobacter electrodiphilus TaxID=225196 RepID=UPI0003A67DEA|nr:DUF3750 domain-containing protein [Geopsychrobacter electrodiphilus]
MRPAVKKALKLLFPMIVLLITLSNCATHNDWHHASRASSGLAPDPATTSEAVLQIYGAPAWSWRGWFAIHTWIAAKPSGADHYTVYEVIGWRLPAMGSVVRIAADLPDRLWYGKQPRLLNEHRGQGVDALIQKVDTAARRYPWGKEYTLFPGPNSNTFTAWIGIQVPELKLDLPFSAIGSGYAVKAN